MSTQEPYMDAGGPTEQDLARWAKWDDLRARQAEATTDTERAELKMEEEALRNASWNEVLEQDMKNPEGWWWLSFCDPDKPEGEQFLGVCIVHGGGGGEAIQNAWTIGCNPGGEVMSIPIPEQHVPDEQYRRRLLSKEELEEAGLA